MKAQMVIQAEHLTKAITPEYPLGYTEVYDIVLNYLMECSQLEISYSREEIDRRIRSYVARAI